MRERPIRRNNKVATTQIAALSLEPSSRAVRRAARAQKKQQLASECPLGKLYDSGASRLKKGTGRGRLKATFRVVFSKDAPIMVIAKSFASRRHFRYRNHSTTTIVARVRKSVDPRNDMPRISEVNAGEAN